MRKYFIFKSSDQDKSLVEAFNKLLLDTKRKKIITFSVLIVCFIMSAYSLSSNNNSGGGSVFSSPKDKAISKIKHYQELNEDIIKALEEEDFGDIAVAHRESDKYFQEVLSQDEYLNEEFNMEGIASQSYTPLSNSLVDLSAELNKNGEESTRLPTFINTSILLAQDANSNLDYILDELGEDVL
ncbi:hypothetical protein [Mammaliicoccus lentus]|uniref:hypothetical protein n=1 Tax=Mammaliicoccus lentus TaxID=42858 RepID=UPI001072614A|nr:hypothetical protein [Mammaliicoccus lentus]MBF0793352.1 hypothetical protein [Mammaliicoccus lentus]TFV17853.1 hypothetical protein E4T78_01715 [Mammaliicoccus lentus]